LSDFRPIFTDFLLDLRPIFLPIFDRFLIPGKTVTTLHKRRITEDNGPRVFASVGECLDFILARKTEECGSSAGDGNLALSASVEKKKRQK
jgi:hypothetical protein